MFDDINFLGVIVAAILGFALGGLWYSKLLFGNVWLRQNPNFPARKKHSRATVLLAFILSLIAALTFAIFLGSDTPTLDAVLAGLLTGVGWVATSLGINYLFSQKSLSSFLIDSGYHILQFTLYGLVLGWWH